MEELEIAKRHYYSRQFSKAEELLRKCLNEGLRNIEVFKYLGLTEIFLGDLDNARRSLERAVKVTESDDELLNGLAFLELKGKKIQSAVDQWLNILEKNPSFHRAQKNLDRLKNAKDADHLADRALPQEFLGATFTIPWKPVVVVCGAIALAALIFSLIRNLPVTSEKEHHGRLTVSSVRLPQTDDFIVSSTADSMFRFQNSEVKPLFSLCKRYIRQKNINNAIVLINKVLHSNLKDSVKQQFLALKEFIPEPYDYRSVRKNVRFSELFNDPTVNDGIFLVLSGRVRQMRTDGSGTDFLVNASDDSGESTEIVVNSSEHYNGLQNGVEVTILCRFKSILNAKGRIRVEGLKIWKEKKLLLEMQSG